MIKNFVFIFLWKYSKYEFQLPPVVLYKDTYGQLKPIMPYCYFNFTVGFYILTHVKHLH